MKPRYAMAPILAIFLAMPVLGYAEKVVLVTTEFPPYLMLNDGQIGGLQADIVREIGRRAGLETDIRVLPWSRALNEVRHGKADGIFMPVYTEERTQYMHFTSESPGSEQIAILARKGSGIKASDLADLKGKRIGFVLGYSYGKAFDNDTGVEKDGAVSNETMLTKLAHGRHHLVAADVGLAKYLAGQQDFEVEVVLLLQDNPWFIGFSKALGPRGSDLAARFSTAIRKLKDEGVIKRMEHKYYR